MPQLRRKLKRLAHRLFGRARPIILMYHRVADTPIDPWSLSVSPENFAAQMRVLKRKRKPVPLDWMVEQVLAGKPPKGTVAITFDDAYRDVLRNAKPVLAELGIPATVFVVTDKLGNESGFWWDRLATAVMGGTRPAQPPSLSFIAPHDRRDIEAAFSGDDLEALHLALWHRIRFLDPVARDNAVDEVETAFACTAGERAPVMTPGEIMELIEGGLISVGAHTLSHPSLPSLSHEDQRAEIGGSKAALEALTGQPIRRLAYPFGDYDARSEATARELGFDYAVSVEAGAANDIRARFRLPRHDIKNWNGAAFEKQLQWLK